MPFVDPPREALGDRRLADARLADEHGVVLPPPAEDLNGAIELVVAADQWVDASLGCFGDQIGSERFEGVTSGDRFAFVVVEIRVGVGVAFPGDDVRARAVRDVTLEVERGDPCLLQQEGRVRFIFLEQLHEHVAPVDGLHFGRDGMDRGSLKDPLDGKRLPWLDRDALGNARQTLLDELFELFPQTPKVCPARPQGL